ncbi:FitA-like ribbon-helix-helix domain-containing protein [Bythopirellula goksoeyrii]|uniref:Antitoxin FitA-like ribbon-helix-helix domain-containing protein n=1 Tax=Bythopirellula goksoeyrii TaxID=1400387 RepID=A0A5B9QDC1_9BACT|nr:Arc family DNA-binding protein [Bythopirellula goksoeyrii]QEG37057.1 hypothetical protein Pr1d_43970 [Bythopirellula goksoeyrii]
MAQFIVRNLEDDVRDKLRELARSHGQSMEETVREILRRAVMKQHASQPHLGSRIAKRFEGVGLEQDIEELRGQPIQPENFDR